MRVYHPSHDMGWFRCKACGLHYDAPASLRPCDLSPDQWRPLLELMRTGPRPAHWTSHRDGTHTQSTDEMNALADWIAMPLNDSNEQDAA